MTTIDIPKDLQELGWEPYGKYGHAMVLEIDKESLTYFFVEKIDLPVAAFYECKIIVGLDTSILLARAGDLRSAVGVFEVDEIARLTKGST